jgi:hypothetical protein
VTDDTHGAAEKVDLTKLEILADTVFYALWGTTTKTNIASGTGHIKGDDAAINSNIPVATLQEAAETATLEIALSLPTEVYKGDGWGVGQLLDGVGGWGETLFSFDTPNPGPAAVDGKKSFTLSWTVAELLTAIEGKTTEALKINAYNGLDDAALEWSIDIVTFTIE